jgi:hypothetical protein
MTIRSVSALERTLSLAGLLPQFCAAMLVLGGSEWRWVALAVGYGYAAIIFSFLGGIWWGLALRDDAPPDWLLFAAVTPGLIATATFIPWTLGLSWPGPSLFIVGLCLILSPLIDRAIGQRTPLPGGWQKLRWTVSLGLGGLTVLLGVCA